MVAHARMPSQAGDLQAGLVAVRETIVPNAMESSQIPMTWPAPESLVCLSRLCQLPARPSHLTRGFNCAGRVARGTNCQGEQASTHMTSAWKTRTGAQMSCLEHSSHTRTLPYLWPDQIRPLASWCMTCMTGVRRACSISSVLPDARSCTMSLPPYICPVIYHHTCTVHAVGQDEIGFFC